MGGGSNGRAWQPAQGPWLCHKRRSMSSCMLSSGAVASRGQCAAGRLQPRPLQPWRAAHAAPAQCTCRAVGGWRRIGRLCGALPPPPDGKRPNESRPSLSPLCRVAAAAMQALRTSFFGQTFKTSVATQQQPSSNATRQVTCMAKKKVSALRQIWGVEVCHGKGQLLLCTAHAAAKYAGVHGTHSRHSQHVGQLVRQADAVRRPSSSAILCRPCASLCLAPACRASA